MTEMKINDVEKKSVKQPKKSILVWIITGGFGSDYIKEPGSILAALGQVALVMGAGTVFVALIKESNKDHLMGLILFLLAWLIIGVFSLYFGYKKYSAAYDKRFTNK